MAGTASGGAGTAIQGQRVCLLFFTPRTGRVPQDPIDGREARATMNLDKAIERILELSADAQIARRGTDQDSPWFHTLTGVIAAYGKVLTLLIAEQTAEKNSPQDVAPLEGSPSERDPQDALPTPYLSSLRKQAPASSPN